MYEWRDVLCINILLPRGSSIIRSGISGVQLAFNWFAVGVETL
jgi:hypothetical protein